MKKTMKQAPPNIRIKINVPPDKGSDSIASHSPLERQDIKDHFQWVYFIVEHWLKINPFLEAFKKNTMKKSIV